LKNDFASNTNKLVPLLSKFCMPVFTGMTDVNI